MLRSSQAKGAWSFRNPKHLKKLTQLIYAQAKKYGVSLQQLAVVGNHIHMMIKIPNRQVYLRFIRSLSGSIVLLITGANKLKALAGKFWDYRPFTRIVIGRRGFEILRSYIKLNEQEALGTIAYKKDRLKGLSPPEWVMLI